MEMGDFDLLYSRTDLMLNGTFDFLDSNVSDHDKARRVAKDGIQALVNINTLKNGRLFERDKIHYLNSRVSELILKRYSLRD